MKCPGCTHEISDADDRCKVCSFTLAEIDHLATALPRDRPPTDVCDPAGTLSRVGVARVQVRLDEFEERTGSEFKVLVLPTLKPLLPSEAAFWIFQRWDVGGKDNRGLLLVLGMKDQAIQCEVGHPLEPFLTDDEVGRVLDFHMVPLLRADAVDDAVYHGVDLLARMVEIGLEDVAS